MAQGKFTTSPTPSNIVSAVNAMVDDIAGKAASSHNHSAANITSGTLAVARGGTGVTANPSLLTNLGSTSAASVFAASPRPGVTGTLPVANGGTGQTTASGVRNALGLGNTTGALPIANGGTGATTASQARVNLGLDSTTGLAPTGTIIAFAGSSIPSGYLACDGSAISRTTYANLWAVIGTTYGSGDGSITFNLPNLTDKFIQGSDTVGTVKSAGLPNITGSANAVYNNTVGQPTGAFKSNWINARRFKGEDGGGHQFYFNAANSNSIYGKSTTVQPPALTMRYIIKY